MSLLGNSRGMLASQLAHELGSKGGYMGTNLEMHLLTRITLGILFEIGNVTGSEQVIAPSGH